MEGDDGVRDVEYLRGLEAAVASGVDYGLEIVAHGGAESSPFPMPVLSQARLAARHRIPSRLVIRRYLAAKSVISDFVFRTAAEPPVVHSPAVHKASAALDVAFDRLITSVSVEYEQEQSARSANGRSQRLALIQRLLRGEPADATSLGYEFGGHHLGLVVQAPDPKPLLRSLSKDIDVRLLMVRPTDEETWAWLGKSDELDPGAVIEWADSHWPNGVPLGIGEVSEGLTGWRRTHAQARAAAGLSYLGSQGVTRYRDIALHSAVCRDPLLLESLREMYLEPLAKEGDRGEILRATLCAFFDSDRNCQCAASMLGVTRQTVSKRLQLAEQRIGQPIGACGDVLRAALQLELGGISEQLDNS